MGFVDGMNIKENELMSMYGWTKNEMRKVRDMGSSFEGHTLWYREESKKPKHLQTIWWTDVGLLYLTEYFKTIATMKEPSPVEETRVLTKTEFDKIVNDTEWVGKIIRNSYKNANTVLVEHDIGFRVIVTCRDNKVLPRNSYVSVDTRNNRHTIRKPAFKTYEKAKQA